MSVGAPHAEPSVSAGSQEQAEARRYADFGRADWAALRESTPLTLSPEDIAGLGGLIEVLRPQEVRDVYLPLSRLLNLHIGASHGLHQVTDRFLGRPVSGTPYVIGIAGSVAVGKSTTARVLQALLSRWPDHPRVDLVTTDGFLLPNAELERRGLLGRKGFPQTYDVRRLLRFVADVKAGVPAVRAPVYSHVSYDVVPGGEQVVDRPDVLVLEGLNVLQARRRRGPFLSDFFDFSLYVDADVADVRRWYVERFLRLRETVFTSPESYFRRYAHLADDDARAVAEGIWAEVNEPNLQENIAPTRVRASLVLRKGPDHGVQRVRLRRV